MIPLMNRPISRLLRMSYTCCACWWTTFGKCCSPSSDNTTFHINDEWLAFFTTYYSHTTLYWPNHAVTNTCINFKDDLHEKISLIKFYYWRMWQTNIVNMQSIKYGLQQIINQNYVLTTNYHTPEWQSYKSIVLCRSARHNNPGYIMVMFALFSWSDVWPRLLFLCCSHGLCHILLIFNTFFLFPGAPSQLHAVLFACPNIVLRLRICSVL